MYQKILLCALVFCCCALPARASDEIGEEGVLTSQDLQTVATEAKSWAGTRYRYGGKDKNGVDCSHFVYAVYSQVFEGFDYRMATEYLNDADFSTTQFSSCRRCDYFSLRTRGFSSHGHCHRCPRQKIYRCPKQYGS